MGALAIVFALSMDSVLDILLYSYNFWSPIILVPLVGGIFGYIISLRAFIISGILSFTLVVVWQAYFAKIVGFDGLILGVLINLICFICAYTYNKFISKVEVVNI